MSQFISLPLFDINRYTLNPAPPMQTSTPKPTHISRSAFQWILHQSLVADERFIYRGLIGAIPDEPCFIQKVGMIKGDEDIAQTLDVWAELDIVCLGFFHFENEEVLPALLDAMPKTYTQLQVSLSEKGRLDLLASFCEKGSASVAKLNLDLIEDGQKDTVV